MKTLKIAIVAFVLTGIIGAFKPSKHGLKITVTAEKVTKFTFTEGDQVVTKETPYSFTINTSDHNLTFRTVDSNSKLEVTAKEGQYTKLYMSAPIVVLRTQLGVPSIHGMNSDTYHPIP